MDKLQTTYNEIFRILRDLQPDIKPLHIMCDFERAIINAARNNFTDVQVHGCNFHFCQCIWRHVQDVGLQTEYANNTLFAHKVKMLMALAFLAPKDVINGFEELVATEFWTEDENDENDAAKQNLLLYFESTYIGFKQRFTQGRKSPLFAIELWNMHDLTVKREYILCTDYEAKFQSFHP